MILDLDTTQVASLLSAGVMTTEAFDQEVEHQRDSLSWNDLYVAQAAYGLTAKLVS